MTEGGYHDQQVLLSGPWHWLVVWYFYLGGVSGASYLLAVVARLVRGKSARQVSRAGRLVSVAAIAPAPALLILDLGRRRRFHHMLRVFKPLSPMNMGAWALSIFGAASGLAAWRELASMRLLPGPLGSAGRALPERSLDATGGAAALYFSGYTGTLLAATAIPLWARTPMLGGLFMSSAAATGTAAVEGVLLLGAGRASGLQAPRLAALGIEAVISEVYVRRLGEEVAAPLKRGRNRHWFRAYQAVGLLAPLALAAAPGRSTKVSRLAAVAATLVGGFCLRAAIVEGGHESAENPVPVLLPG
ncbi:MAG: NrfD/PsrC family molybdoenzyme membrane anchor subunit [Candidatus Dormibacteria bacterium]